MMGTKHFSGQHFQHIWTMKNTSAFNLALHSCTEKIVFTLLYILSFGELCQEIYDHLLEAPVSREQLNHYRNVAENARSELAATLVKFECAQSEVRLCIFIIQKWDFLASCRVKQSIEVITKRIVGHRFKPFGKVYAFSLIVCLSPSYREFLRIYAFAIL